MANTELRARFTAPGRSALYLAATRNGRREIVRDNLGTLVHAKAGIVASLADGTYLGTFPSQPQALDGARRAMIARGDI